MKPNSDNKMSIGRFLFDQSQAINIIKLYGQQIFNSNYKKGNGQSQMSFNISSSQYQSGSQIKRAMIFFNDKQSSQKYQVDDQNNDSQSTKRKKLKQYHSFVNKSHNNSDISWGQQYNPHIISKSYVFDPEKHNINASHHQQNMKNQGQTIRIVKKGYDSILKKKQPSSISQENIISNQKKYQTQRKKKNQQRFIQWKNMASNGIYSKHLKGVHKTYSQTKFYKSPYSQQLCNPKVSNGQNYKSKIDADRQLNQAKKLKRKLFQISSEREKIDKQIAVNKKQNAKMVKYSTKKATARYMQQKPIMDGMADYINKNIYGIVRTQCNYDESQRFVHKKQNKKSMSKQKRQQLWGTFIQKNKDWQANKNCKLTQKRLQKQKKQREQSKKEVHSTKELPQPTVQQYLKRINRQKMNLKEKLLGVQYKPVVYTYQRNLINKQRSRFSSNKVKKIQVTSKQKALKNIFNHNNDHKLSYAYPQNRVILKNPEQIQFVVNRQ